MKFNPPPGFVNLYGLPLGKRPKEPPSRAAAAPGPAAAQPEVSAAGVEAVYDALCLAGSPRPKAFLMHLLRTLDQRSERGARLTLPEVTAALKALRDSDRISLDEGQGHAATDDAAQQRLTTLLLADDAPRYHGQWLWAHCGAPGEPGSRPQPMAYFSERAHTVAWLRLLLLGGGLDSAAFNACVSSVRGALGPAELAQALCSPFVPVLFERMEPRLRSGLIELIDRALGVGNPIWQPLLDWTEAQLAREPAALSASLRMKLAERRLQRGDRAGVVQALAGLDAMHSSPLFNAALQALDGHWAAAATAFSEHYKALQRAINQRRGAAPYRLMWLYALALLMQPNAAAWTAARKFCIAESGSRNPSPDTNWGLWAHAAAVRLGDQTLEADSLGHERPSWPQTDYDELLGTRLLLSGWLGQKTPCWTPATVAATVETLDARGQWLLADLARQAAERLGLHVARAEGRASVAPAGCFGAASESWRDALASIAALGEARGTSSTGAEQKTLQWRIRLGRDGVVDQVAPWELPASGRGKAKPVPLSRLKKDLRLDPRDAAVARCIRTLPFGGTALEIDADAAALALVNHPAVILDDASHERIELREALPELEVQRRRADATPGAPEVFVFRLLDALGGASIRAGSAGAAEVRIFREGPGRARLLRITQAQRRVAELVTQDWQVPVGAQAELDAALRVLAGHFQLHSDASAGEPVPAHPRLRAQLTPDGTALRLRLVVQPFGDFGPVLAPGHGRARLLTVHGGLQLATERDLAAETAHLASVLEALPWLGEAAEDDASWFLDDAEDALRSVEALPTLPAVASLDWPRGKAMQVQRVAAGALKFGVGSGRDWFSVEAELKLDEQRVLGLQQLLALVREARGSRFVALGDGRYLALTERLRRQLADLDALGQGDKQGLRVPAAAAAFLAETLDDDALKGDAPWARRIKALNEAAAMQPELPGALQAQLRGYQAEGFAWMVRLAHAGLGAVLADDMGLGKTVQTLALLLQRAALGPALVVAPTSVCGNWAAEAARFAPTLRVLVYGEGERATMLQQVAAHDLVIASYALVQIDEAAFAAREWATLVIDEAQAVKNAATKRAQAIGALPAGFRLALTGTPVENRLADLWSIMNLLNPGLLGSASQFQQRWAAPIERERDNAVRDRLKRLVAPFLLRRTKAQVLTDLPPRTEIVHRVEPGPEERALLEALRRESIERIAAVADSAAPTQAAFHVLAELTRLRRAACDPRLVVPELGRIGAKVQEFEQLAIELVAGRHKALVFSQFTDFLKLLAERLDSAGIRYQMLDGSTPAAERTRRVNAFQAGEGDLFLISLKAGGFGLNLTAADYVLIADPWWNPAAEDQALGRAHRIGQLRPVTVYRLVTAGSIEERIIELHRDKRALADGLLDGQDQGRPIAADDLRELLMPVEANTGVR